jgi:hypothetical protein
MAQPGFFAMWTSGLRRSRQRGDPLEPLSAVVAGRSSMRTSEAHRRGEGADPQRPHAVGLVQGQATAEGSRCAWTIIGMSNLAYNFTFAWLESRAPPRAEFFKASKCNARYRCRLGNLREEAT